MLLLLLAFSCPINFFMKEGTVYISSGQTKLREDTRDV